MAIEELILGGVVGLLTGGIAGFIFPMALNKLRLKSSIKRIRKQKITYMLDGKEYDFIGEIDKQLESNSKSEGVDLPKKGEGILKDGLIVPSPSENQNHGTNGVRHPSELNKQSTNNKSHDGQSLKQKTKNSSHSEESQGDSKIAPQNPFGVQGQTKLTELNQSKK